MIITNVYRILSEELLFDFTNELDIFIHKIKHEGFTENQS